MSTRFTLVLLAVAAASCKGGLLQGGPDHASVSDGDFVETAAPLKGADLDALWARGELVLGMEGYTIDAEETSFAERELVTRWNNVLGLNRYAGYRTRAWVRLVPATPDSWKVSVAVQRQRNGDIRNPSEAMKAKWEVQPADRARAGVILWKIESGFRAPGSDEDSDEKTN